MARKLVGLVAGGDSSDSPSPSRLFTPSYDIEKPRSLQRSLYGHHDLSADAARFPSRMSSNLSVVSPPYPLTDQGKPDGTAIKQLARPGASSAFDVERRERGRCAFLFDETRPSTPGAPQCSYVVGDR